MLAFANCGRLFHRHIYSYTRQLSPTSVPRFSQIFSSEPPTACHHRPRFNEIFSSNTHCFEFFTITTPCMTHSHEISMARLIVPSCVTIHAPEWQLKAIHHALGIVFDSRPSHRPVSLHFRSAPPVLRSFYSEDAPCASQSSQCQTLFRQV